MKILITGLALLFLCGFVCAVGLFLMPTKSEPTFNRGDKVKLNGQIQGYLAVGGSFTKPVTIKGFCTLIYQDEVLDRYYFKVAFNETKPSFKTGSIVSLSKTNFAELEYRIINEKYKQPN